MADLIYSVLASLDGYIADRDGNFDWAEPDDEVHTFVNDLERPVGTYLYGRRMYEVMVAWETMDLAAEAPYLRDYQQIWRAADKVVFSTTLTEVRSERTRLESVFDPAAIREMKASSGADIGIGGPGLAAHAIRAGLVDATGASRARDRGRWHPLASPMTSGWTSSCWTSVASATARCTWGTGKPQAR